LKADKERGYQGNVPGYGLVLGYAVIKIQGRESKNKIKKKKK